MAFCGRGRGGRIQQWDGGVARRGARCTQAQRSEVGIRMERRSQFSSDDMQNSRTIAGPSLSATPRRRAQHRCRVADSDLGPSQCPICLSCFSPASMLALIAPSPPEAAASPPPTCSRGTRARRSSSRLAGHTRRALRLVDIRSGGPELLLLLRENDGEHVRRECIVARYSTMEESCAQMLSGI